MTDHGDGSRSVRPEVRADGGRDNAGNRGKDSIDDGGTDEFADDRVEEVEVEFEGSRGGVLSRIFPGRDPMVKSLKQQLRQEKTKTQQLNTQLQELESRVKEIERENEALEETKASYEQRQFRLDALLGSVGRSFDQASDELAGYGVSVGDLDITLHADVSGGGQKDTLDLRLVKPDEEIDADRLSTISFSVGSRGRLRHYGHAGAQQTGGVGGRQHVPAGDEEPTDTRDDTSGDVADASDTDTDDTAPTAPPAEVPNLNGMPAEEAMQRLAEKGFEGHVEYRPDEKPVGMVVEQWPRAFAVAPRDASIVLFVGGAEGAK